MKLSKEQREWLSQVLRTVGLLYVSIPMEDLYQVYKQGDESLSLKEFTEAARELTREEPETQPYLREGKMTAASYIWDPQNLAYFEATSDWLVDLGADYYIPTVQEVKEIASCGYIKREGALMMERFARELIGFSQEEAEGYVRSYSIIFGSQVEDTDNLQEQAYENLARHVAQHDDTSKLDEEEGRQAVKLLWEERPLFAYLGHTRGDMQGKKAREGAPQSPDFSRLRGQRFSIPYPNDPCPCGSGKKFKKCHGRQRHAI